MEKNLKKNIYIYTYIYYIYIYYIYIYIYIYKRPQRWMLNEHNDETNKSDKLVGNLKLVNGGP